MSTENAKALRRAARRIIDRGWCQGAEAKTPDGVGLPEDHPFAASWCATGAFLVEGGIPNSQVGLNSLERFNDAPGRTADEVALALLFEAELAEAGE